jgi:hypothetical protein
MAGLQDRQALFEIRHARGLGRDEGFGARDEGFDLGGNGGRYLGLICLNLRGGEDEEALLVSLSYAIHTALSDDTSDRYDRSMTRPGCMLCVVHDRADWTTHMIIAQHLVQPRYILHTRLERFDSH